MTKTNLEKDSRDRKRQTRDEQLDKGKDSLYLATVFALDVAPPFVFVFGYCLCP
jgi:hypothetical protein